MKKYLLLLFLNAGLLTISIHAQPTLTQAGVAYAAGDVIYTTVSTYQNPGSGGASQTWDFSAMPDSGTGMGSVVAASSTQAFDSFPTATVALFTGGSDYFYNANSSVMQFLGAATDTVIGFHYVNPEDQLRFPFNYNDTYTDPWRAIEYASGYNILRSGTSKLTADGYGTVITPNQTYTNAMRVHYVEHYTDSLFLGSWNVFTYVYDEYRWYVNGIHYPVASVDTSSYTYLTSTSISKGGSYLSTFTGIKPLAGINSLNVYPNPASDFLTIDLNLATAKNVEVKIFNSLGAEVQVPAMNEGIAGDNRYRLDVKKLPQGIYFAQIIMEGVLTSTRQFIIAR